LKHVKSLIGTTHLSEGGKGTNNRIQRVVDDWQVMLLQSTGILTSDQYESVADILIDDMRKKYPNDEANIKIWEEEMTGPSAYQTYENGYKEGSEKITKLVGKLGNSDVDDVATMHTGIKSKALMLSSFYEALKKIDSKIKKQFGIEAENVKVKNVEEASNGKLLVEVEHVDGRALDNKIVEVDVTDANSKTMSYIQETDSDNDSDVESDINRSVKADIDAKLGPEVNSKVWPDIDTKLGPDVNSKVGPDIDTKVGPSDIDTNIPSDVSHTSSGKLAKLNSNKKLQAINKKVDKVNKFLGAYGVFAGLKAGEQSITAGNVEGIIQGFGQSAHSITTMIRFKGSSISEKIFQKVGQPVLKTIGKAVTKALGPLKKFVSANTLVVAKKLGSKFGKLANRLPFVGISFGIWSVVNDAKALANAETTEDQVRFGINLALDSVSLTLDVVQAFVPGLAPIIAPISLAITIVGMFIDGVWDSVSSLIKQVDCSNGTSTVSCIFQYAAAVIEGTFIGIGKTFASFFYSYPYEEVKATADFKEEFYNLDNYFNTTQEFGIVNFAAGKLSGYGGNVDFNLSSGVLCIKIDKENRCKTVQIQPQFTNIALGIGKTYNIMYTESYIKLWYFFFLGSVNIMNELVGDSSTLRGTYHGNNQNNQFLAINDLPAEYAWYLDHELADYTYHLFGHGGNDTFHLGPQTFFITGRHHFMGLRWARSKLMALTK
jgi:hypothetical protein